MKSKQRARILNHINVYGSIDRMSALRDCGCFELSAQLIKITRETGIHFKSTRKTVTNQFGEACSVVEYTIAEEVQNG